MEGETRGRNTLSRLFPPAVGLPNQTVGGQRSSRWSADTGQPARWEAGEGGGRVWRGESKICDSSYYDSDIPPGSRRESRGSLSPGMWKPERRRNLVDPSPPRGTGRLLPVSGDDGNSDMCALCPLLHGHFRRATASFLSRAPRPSVLDLRGITRRKRGCPSAGGRPGESR